ncbi:VWA domain-containing protein [uncultured Paenibacillus sp.]|uniref:vWA domain-containing protein n=1 Tax=uncultured Paenibacillus sp. TaxID=227322 RepID=UPI0028D67748|nr:VWA domain-containing protein [uncultured Paenibacillus sp.]
MGFQSAVSAWYALSLPLIALMYLLKRTYVDTEISSGLLWRRVLREQEANRPWQKLRRQLLLLMQLLAAALLAFALMQPYVEGAAASSAPAAAVLDVSASMAGDAAIGGGTAWEQAKAAFRQWLNEQPSGKPVTLIAAGEEPDIVLADETDKNTLLEAVNELKLNYGSSDGPAALSLADAVLKNGRDGEIVVFTDGRWPGAEAASFQAGHPVRIVPVQTGRSNVSVAAFGVKPLSNGTAYSGVVTLIHYGAEPATGTLTVTAYKDGREFGRPFNKSVTLRPGEQRSYPADRLPEADYYRADIDIPDAYAADDKAYAFPVTDGERRVLLVGKGNLFLDKALQLAGVRTVQADPESFKPTGRAEEEIDWIVLDGVNEEELDSREWKRLLANKPLWRIRSAGSPPSGAVAAEPNGSGASVRDHPVTRYLTFQDLHISRLVKADAGALGDPIVTYGGVPAIYAGAVSGKPGIVFAFDLHDSDLPLRPEFPILVAQAAEWMSGGASGHLGRQIAGTRFDVRLHTSAAAAVWEPVEAGTAGEGAIAADVTERGLSSEQTAPAVPGLYRFVEKDAGGAVLGARLLAVTPEPGEGAWNKPPFTQIGSAAPKNGGGSAGGEGDADGAGGEGTAGGEAAADKAGTGSRPSKGVNGSGATNSASAALPVDRQSLIPWIACFLLLLLAAEWGVYRRGTAG